MKSIRRYLVPGMLAAPLLAALLPVTGLATTVSHNGTGRGTLYFKTPGAPEKFTWTLRADLEPGYVTSGEKNFGYVTVTLPASGTGVALRPWEGVVGGDHEHGFKLTSRDNPSHTLTFDMVSADPGAAVWQDGWFYLPPFLNDTGANVMMVDFLLRDGQTLSAGYYPLVLEAGTWTP